MTQMQDVCSSCGTAISNEFGPGGPRSVVLIDSDMLVSQPCFVHDTIVFKDQGRLIFGPQEKGGRYAERYSVVCRKLIVDGGGGPLVIQPCDPFDPTGGYKSRNLITWFDRIYTKGSPGAAWPGPAAAGASFDTDDWSDLGQGNGGKDGGNGSAGATGNGGTAGIPAPSRLTVVALEVEFRHQGNLIVDWHGQNGGDGAAGQDGGPGGDGMGGRDGHVDESWTGDSCGRQPGDGGDGGDGGAGGAGGSGGDGGRAGAISVVTPTANLIPGGAFVSGSVAFVCGGANGGKGGKGGKGSQQFGAGGKAGKRGGNECGTANPGVGGNGADPGPAADGANGGAGSTGSLVFEAVEPPASSTCADIIPIIPVVASLTPGAGFQDTSVAVAIGGTGFDPSATSHGVAVSGTGVSAQNVVIASSTAITAVFDIAASAAVGPRDVVVQSGPYQGTLVGGFSVDPPLPPTVGSIVPNSGVAGTAVNVTVTGTQFDPAAALHLLQISGAGVSASGLSVASNTSLSATLTINGIAPAGARDVSVTAGSQTSAPLVGAFTVVAPPAPTVTSMAPSSGARNAVVNVTITGTQFNPASPIHQIGVSGAGITVSAVVATSATTITGTFTIANLAPQTARDISVTVGAQNSAPLVGAFTVT
jgi:hypothetical protein